MGLLHFQSNAIRYSSQNKEDEDGWKVVLRIEVKGRRVDIEMEKEEELPIL